MKTSNYATVLLSSRERKAAYRAAYSVYTDGGRNAELADHLCDELDDGGIWNPCLFRVVPSTDGIHPSGSLYPVVMVLKLGKAEHPQHEHDIDMVVERLAYCSRRNNGPSKSKHDKPAFYTSDGYYGTNWDEQRQKAIHRDGCECANCGLTRKEHYDQYDSDLHVHHITPIRSMGSYSKANELENLVTLCIVCHQRTERGLS